LPRPTAKEDVVCWFPHLVVTLMLQFGLQPAVPPSTARCFQPAVVVPSLAVRRWGQQSHGDWFGRARNVLVIGRPPDDPIEA